MAEVDWKNWHYLKIEVEPGQFFWFGGPFTAAELWDCALQVLTQYGKGFPVSMKQVKGMRVERGLTLLPDKDEPETVKTLACPQFHIWCGISQAEVEAQMVAQKHQLEQLFKRGK